MDTKKITGLLRSRVVERVACRSTTRLLSSPETLCNGKSYNFIDLAECCLAHPFCSMFVTLRVAKYSLEYDDETLEYLRQAYLASWTLYEPMERLQRAFVLAHRLGSLYKVYRGTESSHSLSRRCPGCMKTRHCTTCGCFLERRNEEVGDSWNAW
jgi:hypothetical protein